MVTPLLGLDFSAEVGWPWFGHLVGLLPFFGSFTPSRKRLSCPISLVSGVCFCNMSNLSVQVETC
jgi:hypothetical protein